MTLTASLEDYLEAIYFISQSKRVVRVKDVAQKLGVTMPSVNGAVKNLESRGMLNHAKYDYIELTDMGSKRARGIATRHKTIYRFLHDILGVDDDTAEEDACRIEHVLSKTTMDRLSSYLDEKLGG